VHRILFVTPPPRAWAGWSSAAWPSWPAA